MTAFTYERDLDHLVAAEVEQTIRSLLEELLTSQGLESVLVNPGLDHDGNPLLFVHLKFRLVAPEANSDLDTLEQWLQGFPSGHRRGSSGFENAFHACDPGRANRFNPSNRSKSRSKLTSRQPLAMATTGR